MTGNVAYDEWIISLANDWYQDDPSSDSYLELMGYLHSREFSFIVPQDKNRAVDGINLRNYWLEHWKARGADISDEPCSVLEMLVALAQRCCDNMDESEDGAKKWFTTMLDNLGLNDLSDYLFNEAICENIIDRFLNRNYDSDGTGGLFIVHNGKDLRKAEIWYQANWYMSEVMPV